MDMASGADISPVSLESRTNSFPESPSQVRAGNPPNFEQDFTHINTQNTQVHRENSDLGQSPILNHRAFHTLSRESISSSWNRFAIPTKNDSLSSGFPFHPRLYDLKVTHDQWHLFSSDIVNAAKLTPAEDFLAWTAGITTGTVSTPILLVLAPVVGYYAGRSVHRKTVVKSVKEKLLQEGDLRSILRRWNEETFAQKGFQAWLDLPRDPGELHKEYQIDETLEHKTPRVQKKAAKKAARRFRIIITPNDDLMSTISEFSSAVPPPNIPPPVEAATDEYRTPQELHVMPSEPPAYSATKERPGQDQPPVSRSVPSEAVELYATNSREIQYTRPAGFTNS